MGCISWDLRLIAPCIREERVDVRLNNKDE